MPESKKKAKGEVENAKLKIKNAKAGQMLRTFAFLVFNF